jgi:hypothetical protein
MSAPGCPWENGYQESFYKGFKLDLGDPNQHVTLGELVNIEREIFAEAIDKEGMVRLSFPLDIKRLLDEVQSKIDILKKQPCEKI